MATKSTQDYRKVICSPRKSPPQYPALEISNQCLPGPQHTGSLVQRTTETSSAPARSTEQCFKSRRRRRYHPKKNPLLESEAHCPDTKVPIQSASCDDSARQHAKNRTTIEQAAQYLACTMVVHPRSIDRKRRRHLKEILINEREPQCIDGKAAARHSDCSIPSQNNRSHNRNTSDELEAQTIVSKATAQAHRVRETHQTDRSLNIKGLSGSTTFLHLPATPSHIVRSEPQLTDRSVSNNKSHIEGPSPDLNSSSSYCVLPDMDSDYQSVGSDRIISNTWSSYQEPTCSSRKLSSKERRFVEKVRAGVADYRFQSLSHFSLHIDVRPSECVHSTECQIAEDFKMKIIFQNFSNHVSRICRPRIRPTGGIDLNEVQVHDGNNWTSLQKSLEQHFPATSLAVSTEEMRKWWDSNGKSFNWSGLPTELKEIIIQYCMCQPFKVGDYIYSLKGLQLLKSNNPGPSEIIGLLGEWGHLLGVSAEIRKLTLQLCFRGGWLYPQGLSVLVNSHRHFEKSITRLGKYYQIFQHNSVPQASDPKAMTLAHQYKYFPKIYPELKIYGTFMHGIQKVYLEFDFWSSLHFFKVSACGFDRYRPKDFMTCDAFERLPQLSSIYFYLPTRDQPKNDPMRYGPRLFHNDRACPRSLHRLIYEQAAKELAPYLGVHMMMFMDQDEENRFTDLYAAAKSSLKFTDQELNQLWEDSDGGVPLDLDSNSITALDDCDQIESVYEHDTRLDGAGNITLTPYCQCKEPCNEAFAYAGRY
jgi:hypothetical protein